MDLGLLLILLIIPLAVWILSNIFRGFEDKGANNRRGMPPRGRGVPPGRRPPAAGDIDSFLAEINRRRREAAERQGAPPPPPSARPQPVIAREPQTPPRRPRPRPPVATPIPPSRPRPERREARVVEMVVSEPAPSPRVPVVELVEVQPSSPAGLEATPAGQVAVPPPAPTLAPPAGQGAATRALENIAPLLHSKQTLRSAILLQEILGPPRCRRRSPIRS